MTVGCHARRNNECLIGDKCAVARCADGDGLKVNSLKLPASVVVACAIATIPAACADDAGGVACIVNGEAEGYGSRIPHRLDNELSLRSQGLGTCSPNLITGAGILVNHLCRALTDILLLSDVVVGEDLIGYSVGGNGSILVCKLEDELAYGIFIVCLPCHLGVVVNIHCILIVAKGSGSALDNIVAVGERIAVGGGGCVCLVQRISHILLLSSGKGVVATVVGSNIVCIESLEGLYTCLRILTGVGAEIDGGIGIGKIFDGSLQRTVGSLVCILLICGTEGPRLKPSRRRSTGNIISYAAVGRTDSLAGSII